MASLSRGISFRRQGSSGMSWTDTWSFNEEGVLVRTLKEDHHLQRFAGSSLSRIHDSHHDEEILVEEQQTSSCPPPSSSAAMSTQLERSKSVGSSQVLLPASTRHCNKPAPTSVFKWIKRALHKMKK